MYSPLVTERMIAEASTAQGWPLVRSTREQIDTAIQHFEELLDEESGELSRPLNDEEIRFIQNVARSH